MQQNDFYKQDYLFNGKFKTSLEGTEKIVWFTIYEEEFSITDVSNTDFQAIQRIKFDKTMRLNLILDEKNAIDQKQGHISNCIGFQIFKIEEEESKREVSVKDKLETDTVQSNQKNYLHGNIYNSELLSMPSEKTNLFSSNVSLLNFISKDLLFNFELNSNLTDSGLFITLYAVVKSDMESAYKYLKSRIIMTNFHRQYKAIKKLGRGAFTTVYLVTNKDTNKQYAVKLFQKKMMQKDPDDMKGFYNEMKTMNELNHPHIIKLHEVWETRNSFYFVLDFIKSGSLLDKILMHRRVLMNIQSRKDSLIKDSEIKEYIKQILQAVAELHKKGIMHRDIKPDNILLRSKKFPDAVLSDFGLSQKIVKGEKYLFPKCGTPGYVAPEIINLEDQDEDAKYDTKCDIFSIGSILYFMLVLEPPFGTRSAKYVIKNNKKCVINYKHSRFLSLNKNAQDLIQKMLAIKPEDRPTALECLDHKYFDFDEFEDDDESVPCESPVDINNKKNRIINVFHYNVFHINSQGMKSQKQDVLVKLMDSFKYPKIQQYQTSLIMKKEKMNNQNQEDLKNCPPSIEELMEIFPVDRVDNEELNDLFPKTLNYITNKNSENDKQRKIIKNKTVKNKSEQDLDDEEDFEEHKNSIISKPLQQKKPQSSNSPYSQSLNNGKTKKQNNDDSTLIGLMPESK